MVRAIVELVREHGGSVVTHQTVEQILVDKGRAAGVRLAGGRELRSSRGVVASVTPQALVKLTKGHLPETVVEAANNYRYGPGTMVIHLALSSLPDWKDEVARRGLYVHVGPSLEYITAANQEGVAGMLAREPFLIFLSATMVWNSLEPFGWRSSTCDVLDIRYSVDTTSTSSNTSGSRMSGRSTTNLLLRFGFTKRAVAR